MGVKRKLVNDFLSKGCQSLDGNGWVEGSFVDTNIISNQASHPPSHFIGLQRRKEIMEAFMRRHFLKEMVVVP